MRSVRRLFAGVASLAAAAAALSACGKDDPVYLMLVVDTDMAVPEELTEIGLGVYDLGGGAFHDNADPLLDDRLTFVRRLPALMPITVDGDPKELTLRVRVVGVRGAIGRSGGKASLFRDFRVTLPPSGTRQVRVHLSRLDSLTATGTTDTGLLNVTLAAGPTACGPTLQPIDGVCRAPTDFTDPSKLPAYDPKTVFGGGAGPSGSATSCWDAPACFRAGTKLTVTETADGCEAALPDGMDPAKVTFGFLRPKPVAAAGTPAATAAVFTPGTEAALCNGADCYVVLDRADPTTGEAGSGAFTLLGARATFGKGVCDMLRGVRSFSDGGQSIPIVTGVVATDRCPLKTTTTPICAPWAVDLTSGVRRITPS